MRIVVLNSNRLFGEMLRTTLRAAFIGATMSVAHTLTDVDELLRAKPVDLLVTDISAPDGDAFDHFATWDLANHGVKRTLVVTAHSQAALIQSLVQAPIGGIFDTRTEGIENLHEACRDVIGGKIYWSESVKDVIVASRVLSTAIFRVLTPTEQMVLGVIGDGCDDQTAANTLPLTATSIRSVREALHRKLGIQHKGELVERAAHYGFVIRTADGLIRPGLKPLITAHRKPAQLSSEQPLESVA